MYKIHGPSHLWEGLEACTYDPSCLHGLNYGQLSHRILLNKPNQTLCQHEPNQAWITFTLYGHRLELVWCTAFPVHVVNAHAICLSRLEQRCCLVYDFTLGKPDVICV